MIILGLILTAPTSAMADDADDVIALAKAQWAAELANAPAAKVMETVADDYTEFNPTYPTRIDGKKLNEKFAEAAEKDATKLVVADMANAGHVFGSGRGSSDHQHSINNYPGSLGHNRRR